MQMRGDPLFVNNAFFEQVCSHTRLSWQRSDRSECQPEERTPENRPKRQSRILYFDAFVDFLVFYPLAGTLTCLSVAITALCGYTLAQKEALLTKMGSMASAS